MKQLLEILNIIDGYAWGPVLIVLLLGTGIFLAFRLGFPQLRRFKHAMALISGRYDDPEDEGALTHFQALAAALSATIGTGNIAGVGIALAAGGPGAIFWMWVTGFLGMGVKYTECTLGHHYRVVHEDGTASGGPMYYLERGLNAKWLGITFAIFALVASFGIGDMVQANSVAKPLADNLGFPTLATGFIMAILVGLVIIGGIRRIGRVASKLVQLMSIAYVIGALIILIANYEKVPGAFALIFNSAFSVKAASGGFLGATLLHIIREGVARGLFSNESGLGSAPIAHAAAKTKEPVREGLVAMVGPFVDTLIICTMTALVIIATGVWDSGLTSSPLTSLAFQTGLAGGEWIVTFGLVFFAFSTMISWSYYGDRCAEYLFGKKAVMAYRWVFVLVIPLGAYTEIGLIWLLSDIFNAMMAFPNLIGIIGLSPVVYKLSKEYFSREHIPVQPKVTIFRQFWKMTGE